MCEYENTAVINILRWFESLWEYEKFTLFTIVSSYSAEIRFVTLGLFNDALSAICFDVEGSSSDLLYSMMSEFVSGWLVFGPRFEQGTFQTQEPSEYHTVVPCVLFMNRVAHNMQAQNIKYNAKALKIRWFCAMLL
jgi:hypothetical protein